MLVADVLYMLVRSSRCSDAQLRQELASHFLNHDEYNEKYALQILAGSGWSQTEIYCIRFWDSKDDGKQIIALDCLNRIDSPLLDEYLKKAESARAIIAFNENMRSLKEQTQ